MEISYYILSEFFKIRTYILINIIVIVIVVTQLSGSWTKRQNCVYAYFDQML